jgi:NADH-quinone oxidoreductase subunit G
MPSTRIWRHRSGRCGDGAAALRALAALPGQPGQKPFESPILDFYLTNPIARASGVMAECSAIARGRVLEAAE